MENSVPFFYLSCIKELRLKAIQQEAKELSFASTLDSQLKVGYVTHSFKLNFIS